MKKILITVVALALFSATLNAQSGRRRNEPKKPPAQTSESVDGVNNTQITPNGETIEGDVVKFNTSLVMVPVTVMDRSGRYVPQLQRSDFHIFENGVEQKIAYFATTNTPFTVVFLIDTSGSTQVRLDEIQDAAIKFVERLKPEDSVMVMSFDDQIDVLTKPTNDRTAITRAIRRTNTGGGTRLYDAVDQVLKQHLKTITGRKAVVLFTDGMDTTSRRASYDSTIRLAEESDAPIYSVDYSSGGRGVFGQRSPSVLGLPIPGRQSGGASPGDYRRASAYLHALANTTGGRFYSGNSQFGIAQAFTWIAEELGRQYSLGYYPQSSASNGERRQIKVKVDESDVVVKSRDSYIYTKQPYVSESRN
jgi:Ca-activated chloride channel family protein